MISAAATQVPILLNRMFMKSSPHEQLPHMRAPFGEGRTEPADEEQEVMPRGNAFLQRTVRFPRDSLLPVSSDRATASASYHDSHPIGHCAVAVMEELQTADICPSCCFEKPRDVRAGAESFFPSKASSHLRRKA